MGLRARWAGQLKVERVHVRFEDPGTSGGAAFAMGVSLTEVTAVSATEQWQRCAVGADMAHCYKLASLTNLQATASRNIAHKPAACSRAAVFFFPLPAQMYWQSNFSAADAFAGGSRVPQDRFAKSFAQPPPGTMLGPVSATARVTVNKTVNLATPRFAVDLDFGAIECGRGPPPPPPPPEATTMT